MTALPPCVSSAPEHAARRAARRRGYELLRGSQLGGTLTATMADELVAEGQLRGWPDVVGVGRYLALFCARFIDDQPGSAQLAALHEHALTSGEDAWLALALACRAQGSGDDGRAPVEADRDLARATVLLDRCEGPSTVAVCARIECAYACEERDLWEEQLRHCAAAEACLDSDEFGEEYLQVLLLNRAEAELFWLAALRESGPGDALAVRADAARRALRAADIPSLPPVWRDAVHIFGELVDAISPPARVASDRAPEPEGQFASYVHLARALRTADPRQAAVHCERAMETIDPRVSGRVRMLVLAYAVELEAAEAGRETSGLRWGRELTAVRNERRMDSLASIQSLIAVERRAAECALLAEHAYRDDLTGLANRRALARAVQSLQARGVSSVAVGLLDLDNFKTVNDLHGHAVGDAVLAMAADILRSEVREADLVVRLGGDELLVLFEDGDLAGARRRLGAIVDAVRVATWGRLADGLSVSACAGAATGSPERFEAVCAEADAALYVAKRACASAPAGGVIAAPAA